MMIVNLPDVAPDDWRGSILTDTALADSHFCDGEYSWDAESLYDYAAECGCRKYKLPLKHVCLNNNPIECASIPDLAYEVRRVLMSDCDIPIIVSCCGSILDGVHRVVKALVTNREHVWAYRLPDMPEPDEVCDEGKTD